MGDCRGTYQQEYGWSDLRFAAAGEPKPQITCPIPLLILVITTPCGLGLRLRSCPRRTLLGVTFVPASPSTQRRSTMCNGR